MYKTGWLLFSPSQVHKILFAIFLFSAAFCSTFFGMGGQKLDFSGA